MNALSDVEKYIQDVTTGARPACHWEKRAVQRRLDDLNRDDIFFDESAANHALDFYGFLKHTKGKWAGDTFALQPWQAFIVAEVFGWKRKDGTRRYRTAYIEVPRKNGKTTKAAGIGLYLFFADGEAGAEVYSAATKKDQAKITLDFERGSTGQPIADPRLQTLMQLHKQSAEIRKEFGMTPSSRAGIALPEKKKEDKMEGFLERVK